MAILVLSTLLFFPSASAQGTCGDIFAVATSSNAVLPLPLIKQYEQLFPYANPADRSLLELYFHTLETHEKYSASKDELPAQLTTHLREQFANRYELPTTNAEIKIFYLNALHAFYGRVAWEWKKQTVERLSGEPLVGRSLLLAQALMDSYFSFGGMGSDGIKSSFIREVIEHQQWQTYPLKQALEIFRAWEKSDESKNGFFGFHRWLDRHPELPPLTTAELERLYLAISKITKTYSYVHCCKSSFACTTCPHNRKWLKDREDSSLLTPHAPQGH